MKGLEELKKLLAENEEAAKKAAEIMEQPTEAAGEALAALASEYGIELSNEDEELDADQLESVAGGAVPPELILGIVQGFLGEIGEGGYTERDLGEKGTKRGR